MRLRALLGTVGLAVICYAALFVHPPSAGGPRFRDFESYYGAGAAWHYGNDPYSRDVWRTERTIPEVVPTRDEFLPFVGPPFGLPLWEALWRLGWERACDVWSVAMSLSLGIAVFGAFAIARVRPSPAMLLGGLAIAATFGPSISGIALGQVAMVSCAAIVLVALALRLPGGAAPALGASLAAALQPNLAVALVFRIAGVRSAIAIVGAAAVALGGSALALAALGGLPHYLAVLTTHAAAERFIAIQTTPSAVAHAFGAPGDVAGWLAAALAIAVLCALAVQSARGGYAPDERLLLACAALPLAWPFGHEHDFLLALPPALVVLARGRGIAWTLAALGTFVLAVDWLGLGQRPTGVAFEVWASFATACGIVALAPRPWRWEYALPFAGVPVVAGIATLALRHVVPVWPDRLPGGFQAGAHLDAAAVWHAEQIVVGLGAQDPVWGLLRLLPLLACATIWIAASRAYGLGLVLDGRSGSVRVGDAGDALPLGIGGRGELVHPRDKSGDLPHLGVG